VCRSPAGDSNPVDITLNPGRIDLHETTQDS
jgi:hypothetical protein